MLTPFFDNLIDDFGIWQHSDGEKVIAEEGYALDDAARGLIVCLALKKTVQAEALYRYIINSQFKNGFYGFATSEHKYIKYPASEDATGQVIWAMGYASSVGFHENEARAVVHQLSSRIIEFRHIRGYAYALLGSIYIDKKMAKVLAVKLISLFNGTEKEWFWPESVITYGNGIIPYALLRYALVARDSKAADIGLTILEFLHSICQSSRLLGPIGNEGWLSKQDKTVPTFSQQPIDSAYMIWAWLAAYEHFSSEEYYRHAHEWMAWFNGINPLRAAVYDNRTLKAYDGIDKKEVNYHSGAEANICLLLSLYMLKNRTTL